MCEYHVVIFTGINGTFKGGNIINIFIYGSDSKKAIHYEGCKVSEHYSICMVLSREMNIVVASWGII